MKHVYPTNEIAHLWAHKTQTSARNGQGNFYFDGDTNGDNSRGRVSYCAAVGSGADSGVTDGGSVGAYGRALDGGCPSACIYTG